MKKYLFILFSVLNLCNVLGQNPVPLIKPMVPDEYTMFKKAVWRRMDLSEKQNNPFFSLNSEISRLLIQGVQEGLIQSYQSDSCLNIMTDRVFQSNISVEVSGNSYVDDGFNTSEGDNQSVEIQDMNAQPIPLSLFSVMYIKEDFVFDRNRSRMYTYIKCLSLALPADVGAEWNPGGFEKLVANFKYEDVTKLFRNQYFEKAIWYNPQNQAAHLNFSDALELRMFNAPIIKLSNAQDLDIRQEYQEQIAKDPLTAIMIQQKYEYDLLNFESELWEY